MDERFIESGMEVISRLTHLVRPFNYNSKQTNKSDFNLLIMQK